MDPLSNENKLLYEGRQYEPPVARYAFIRKQVTLRSGRILDIGTQDFGLLKFFSSFEKFGIDIVKRDHPDDVRYCIADISQGIPFADCQFHVVTAGEIIEHVLDTEAFLGEVHRVLKPGGELVLTTPNMSYWRNHIQILLNQNPFWVDWKKGQEGHVRYFSPRPIRALMESAGFYQVAVTSIQDAEKGENRFLRTIGRIMQRCSRMHNMLLIVKGKKMNDDTI